MTTYILDTSLILQDPENINLLSDKGNNKIIIPEIVLDEIDNLKKGNLDVNYQARAFNRMLEKFKVTKITKNKTYIETVLSYEKFDIFVISKIKYSTLREKEFESIYNDRRILEIAKLFKTGVLVSNDLALRIRAASLGIEAEPLKHNRFEDIENIDFIKTFTILSKDKHLIPKMKPKDFGVTLSQFTNCEFICSDTNESILTIYKNNGFHYLNEKRLRSLVVNPRNKEQLFFLNMLLDKDLPIVVCAGVTGSGKNILALQGAVELNSGNEKNIKYCRNTVTAGDSVSEIGFLKGDEKQKLAVFTYPLYDSITSFKELEAIKLLTSLNKQSKNKNIRAKQVPVLTNIEFCEKYKIDIININQMRGANLSGIFIMDEHQNSTASINKLMLTRMNTDSKVIILGDIAQIDHPYLNKYNNALSIMLKKSLESDIIGAVKMSKVLRGPIADFAQNSL